jgi:hypothetical protein
MENKDKKPGIVILHSYYQAMQELDNDDQLTIFKAIMEFGFDGIQPNFDKKYLNGYWILIYPTLSKGISNYQTKVNNGSKGGRPKLNSNASKPINNNIIESETKISQIEEKEVNKVVTEEVINQTIKEMIQPELVIKKPIQYLNENDFLFGNIKEFFIEDYLEDKKVDKTKVKEIITTIDIDERTSKDDLIIKLDRLIEKTLILQ